MDPCDLHWLAGLLEGEGSFFTEKIRSETRYAVIEVTMTDEDVVKRAAGLMDVSVAFRHAPAKIMAGHKPTYRARLRGRRAEDLMRQLMPLMGQRRASRIKGILEERMCRESNPGP